MTLTFLSAEALGAAGAAGAWAAGAAGAWAAGALLSSTSMRKCLGDAGATITQRQANTTVNTVNIEPLEEKNYICWETRRSQ